MTRRTALVSLNLAAALAAIAACGPASARGGSAGYHGGLYYRALLTRRPPAYWTGGTVWPAAGAYVRQEELTRAARAAPRPLPPQPVTRRIPEQYVAQAHNATYAGPLWVKTATGWRIASP